MDFRILGPVEGSVDGVPLALGGPRQRALLAYLLLHANEVVSSERLLDELWWEPPGGGTAAVQTLISRLRKAVGGRLATAPSGYSLSVHTGELDLDRVRSLLDRAAASDDPRRRRRLLCDAEASWRGELLSGLDFPFVAAEREALEELRATTIEARLAAELDAGADAALVPELTALIARQPLRERLRELQMLALYRAGRQSDALDVYRDARRTLVDELGLEPGPELRRLEQAILRQDPALMPTRTVRPVRRRRLSLALAAAVAAAAIGLVLLATLVPSGTHRAHVSPFATMSAAAVAAAPLPAGWVTIRDRFSLRRINPTLWAPLLEGTGVSVAPRDGWLDAVLSASGRRRAVPTHHRGHLLRMQVRRRFRRARRLPPPRLARPDRRAGAAERVDLPRPQLGYGTRELTGRRAGRRRYADGLQLPLGRGSIGNPARPPPERTHGRARMAQAALGRARFAARRRPGAARHHAVGRFCVLASPTRRGRVRQLPRIGAAHGVRLSVVLPRRAGLTRAG